MVAVCCSCFYYNTRMAAHVVNVSMHVCVRFYLAAPPPNTYTHTSEESYTKIMDPLGPFLPATHCNTLQHAAKHCNTLQHLLRARMCDVDKHIVVLLCVAVCSRVLQCVVVCCSVLQCVAVRCSVL